MCSDRRVRPSIFSQAELARLLEAADKLHPPFRALTYRTYISLVAVTRRRRSEATALDRSDAYWENGALTNRGIQLHKSRWLPLHPSTITALADYARQRDREFGTTREPAFFLFSRRSDSAPTLPDTSSPVWFMRPGNLGRILVTNSDCMF